MDKFFQLRDGDVSGNASGWENRPYYWTELLTSESVTFRSEYVLTDPADEKPDATLEQVKAKYSKVGIIRVECSRNKTLATHRASERSDLSHGVIPEKAIKGQVLDLGSA